MPRNDEGDAARKRYYVSVQAGQILEDQGAAAYELVIDATDAEVEQLHSLFKQYASLDDDASFHFTLTEFWNSNDAEMNSECDRKLQEIYALIHSCGTDETRVHVERMGIL